jgi:hypothetical protein
VTFTDVALLGNDFDADGDTLSVTITQQPTHGMLVTNIDGSRTYTPLAGFTGTDTFGYVAFDGQLNSYSAAIVTITVGLPPNTAPIADNDNFTIAANTSLTFTKEQLLLNDLDPNGDQLFVTVLSQPANGSLQLNLDDSYTYTPNPGFNGTDTFHYTAFDGKADSTPTSVTIGVGIANTPIQL